MNIIESRNTGTGTITVYGSNIGFAIQLVRSDGTQVNRTARTKEEALVIQSELYLAEPAPVEMYADEQYDE